MTTESDDTPGKQCVRCQRSLPQDAFYRSSKSPDGRQGYCKSCVLDYGRLRAAVKPRKIRKRPPSPIGFKHCLDCSQTKALSEFPRNARSADGRHTYCLLCNNARTRESDSRLHASTRDRHLKRRYGIGDAEVIAMIEAQGGLCAICEGPLDRPHVDHDHETGKVRGILCFNCNAGLGKFKDDRDIVERAAEYLRQHDLETEAS